MVISEPPLKEVKESLISWQVKVLFCMWNSKLRLKWPRPYPWSGFAPHSHQVSFSYPLNHIYILLEHHGHGDKLNKHHDPQTNHREFFKQKQFGQDWNKVRKEVTRKVDRPFPTAHEGVLLMTIDFFFKCYLKLLAVSKEYVCSFEPN